MNRLISEGLESIGIKGKVADIRFLTQSCFPIYLIQLQDNQKLAVKMIDQADMATSEESSLLYLNVLHCPVPNLFGVFTKGNKSLLFMEYISENNAANRSKLLLNSLRKMYVNKNTKWGFGEDNFIGALRQKNSYHDSFESFFWKDRIEPQLKLAFGKGIFDSNFLSQMEKFIYKKITEWELNKVIPTLIHGDLWSGNVLFADKAYFIDPSIAYSHPEQDLAMLELFGSPLSVQDREILLSDLNFPEGFSDRLPFWQVYPLLVHVNLFGGNYVNQFYQRIEFYG